MRVSKQYDHLGVDNFQAQHKAKGKQLYDKMREWLIRFWGFFLVCVCEREREHIFTPCRSLPLQ